MKANENLGALTGFSLLVSPSMATAADLPSPPCPCCRGNSPNGGWEKAFKPYHPCNFGISGDQTTNLIYRITDSGIPPRRNPNSASS